jgi:pimeloyl-ACP methyl ester carboxylesterase
MPIIDLPQGRVQYRLAGPANSADPPVVFVHGLLVNCELWTGVADELARRGVRSYALDLPLGSHSLALRPDAELSPRGVARLIIAFLEALELTDVTLVGNDTGSALCQFVIDTDDTRIGRLVLTNGDAFDHFPPASLGPVFKLGRRPAGVYTLMSLMRPAWLRQRVQGQNASKPLDPALTKDSTQKGQLRQRWQPVRRLALSRRERREFLDAEDQTAQALLSFLDRELTARRKVAR